MKRPRDRSVHAVHAFFTGLLLLCLTGPQTDASPREVIEAEEHGFRVRMPEGHPVHRAASGGGVAFTAVAPDEGNLVQTIVRVLPFHGDAEAVRQSGIAMAASDEAYGEPTLISGTIAGIDLPGLTLDHEGSGQRLRLELFYAARDGRAFVLQGLAPAETFDRWRPVFHATWETLEFVEPSDEERADRELRALASRANDAIDWADDWEDAAHRARESKRPVLVYARMVGGFNMDEALGGEFTDPDVVALLNRRFVPLILTKGMDVPFADPDLYGLSPTTFGSSTLVATPDGEIVTEAYVPTYPFLVSALELAPQLPGPTRPRGDGPEVIEELLARGDHDAARRILDRAPGDIRHQRLRADLLRRERRGEEALALLEEAINATDDEEIARGIDLDAGIILMRLGRFAEARAKLESLGDADLADGRHHEARYWLAMLSYRLDDRDASERHFRQLASAPEAGWFGTLAAAKLTGLGFRGGALDRLDWPDELLSRAIQRPSYPETRMPRDAGERAVEYLIAQQRDDGTFVSPFEIARFRPEIPNELILAATAVAGLGLLEHGGENTVEPVDAAIDASVRLLHRYHEIDAPRWFMDYAVWSRAYVIWLLAEATSHGVRDIDEMREPIALAIAGLADRQQPNGGFSYYVTGDLESGPVAQSISFTTAAVVLALLRAREVGFDVPEEMTTAALDALAAMRNRNGTYEYFLHGAAAAATSRETAAPGAAGRGPVCALALHRGGRVELDVVRHALDLFVEHRGPIGDEIGKVLMHCGDHGQGSHYPLFDYATAALAVRTLPEAERSRYRAALLDELARARTADGAFVDNPLIGTAAGTGLALSTLAALRVDL